MCFHGFNGEACEHCLPRYDGDQCQRCTEGYIGWNTNCATLCLHGYATEPGGSECECYADVEHGHWTGASCDECIEGWALPDCKSCLGGKIIDILKRYKLGFITGTFSWSLMLISCFSFFGLKLRKSKWLISLYSNPRSIKAQKNDS